MSKKGRELLFKFFKEISLKEPTKVEVKQVQAEIKSIKFIDSVTATYAYYELSARPRQPLLLEVVKSMVEKKRQEESSLRHLVVQIMARKKYALSYAAELGRVREAVLVDELTFSDMTALLLLGSGGQEMSAFVSSSLISWLASQKILHNSQLISLYRLSKHLPAHQVISKELNWHLDHQLRTLDGNQLKQVAEIPKERSQKEMRRLALGQESLVKKRLMHMQMSKSRQGGLPGKHWETTDEFNEALEWLMAQGRRAPFFDILKSNNMRKNHIFRKIWQNSTALNNLISYLFNFITEGYWRIPLVAAESIVELLQFGKSSLQMMGLEKNHLFSWVEILVVVTEIARLYPQYAHLLRLSESKMQKKIASMKSGVNDKLLMSLLLLQVEALRRGESFFTVGLIQKMMGQQQIIDGRFAKEAMLMLKFAENSSKMKLTASTSLLYSRSLTKADLLDLIENSFQDEPIPTQRVEKVYTKIDKQFTILKEVILQPSLSCSYAIVNKESNRFVSIIDLDEDTGRSHIFQGELRKEVETNAVTGRDHFNIHWLWKYRYLKQIHGADYFICVSRSALSNHICNLSSSHQP